MKRASGDGEKVVVEVRPREQYGGDAEQKCEVEALANSNGDTAEDHCGLHLASHLRAEPAAAPKITPSCNPWRDDELQFMATDINIEDDVYSLPVARAARRKMSAPDSPSSKSKRIRSEWLRAQSLPEPRIGNLTWPDEPSGVTLDLVSELVEALKWCGKDPVLLRRIFTFSNMSRLLRQAERLLGRYPNVIPVVLRPDVTLTIVGDSHGQFYDVIGIFGQNGIPSSTNWYLFNGDYVDRGSWGVELATMLLAYKLLYPNYVHLLRGNHETAYCTLVYGFKEEVSHKYSKSMHGKFLDTFARIPIAAVVLPPGSQVPGLTYHGNTSPDDPSYVRPEYDKYPASAPEIVANGVGVAILHGGLYREIDGSLGTLRSLQLVKRNIKDPAGDELLEVLWSDPQPANGLRDNSMRGCGTLFGPDVTEFFLRSHRLSLLVRSHEGPDAREKRPYLTETMMDGFAIDHRWSKMDKPSCVTVFSAPNYPQGVRARGNRAAYIRIPGSSPQLDHTVCYFESFPSPTVPSYYVEDGLHGGAVSGWESELESDVLK